MDAWLAEADLPPRTRLPDLLRNPWGYELLPAGRQWDTIVIPAATARAVVEHLSLKRDFVGPVLLDKTTCQAYFFVPPHTHTTWPRAEAPCLTLGSWVVVPASICPGGQLTWLAAPDGSDRLNNPDLLTTAVRRHSHG